ncbi:hypothetical protein J6590_001648 [Homalodisca vitripennis]|nr:hypothetical protein J6590_001648 [Homalodisca vitripennis]
MAPVTDFKLCVPCIAMRSNPAEVRLPSTTGITSLVTVDLIVPNTVRVILTCKGEGEEIARKNSVRFSEHRLVINNLYLLPSQVDSRGTT